MWRALTFLLMLALGFTPASAQPGREASVRTYLQNRFTRLGVDFSDTRYAIAWADLNSDGHEEAIVRMASGGFCGSSGCFLYILSPVRRGWSMVGRMAGTHLPIRILSSRNHDWRDVSVFIAGGGITSGYHARLSIDGRTYPYNPSMPPAQRLRTAGPGRVIISDTTPTVPLFGPQRRPR